MKTYEKVGFTGNWYEDGSKEVGYRCAHNHKSLEAARKCRVSCNKGNGGEIRVYEDKKWIESRGL